MKHSLRTRRSITAALALILVFQAPVFAQGNAGVTPSWALSTGEVIGCFCVLLLVLLAPLVKRRVRSN